MKDFVLQLQCPPPDVALKRAEASLVESERSNEAYQQQPSSSLCACTCPHLLEYLPDKLDLTFAKSETRGWMLRNPVHAMHLSSQLDAEWLKECHDPPVLYGEEQERLQAATTPGIPESWHPWIANEPQKVCELQQQKAEETTDVVLAHAQVDNTISPERTGSTSLPDANHHQNPLEAAERKVWGMNHSNRAPATISEERFNLLFEREQQIHSLQRDLLGNRTLPSASRTSNGHNKKRKDVNHGIAAKPGPIQPENGGATRSSAATMNMPGAPSLLTTVSAAPTRQISQDGTVDDILPITQPVVHFSRDDEQVWDAKLKATQTKVSLWLERFNMSRRSYYNGLASNDNHTTCSRSFFGSDAAESRQATCSQCRTYAGDDVMQCLDCSFIGCYATKDEHVLSEHMMEHMVMKDHNFAVTCGPHAKIFCFKCGDFVDHPVFTQEKQRMDLAQDLPWMAWKDHSLQRSFDALRFMRMGDQGIVWSGMAATYPQLVPLGHLEAVRRSRRRQCLFQGKALEIPDTTDDRAHEFLQRQNEKATEDRCKLLAPVGMYNLGNACYMSAILQCLVHLSPIQSYFLRDVGHHHLSCRVYRDLFEKRSAKNACLACEMDKLFLGYFESTNGIRIDTLLDQGDHPSLNLTSPFHIASDEADQRYEKAKGEPLVTSDMLTVAWKCISHIAGYEQRDAHEFLHSFLDVLGKHMRQYRVRVYNTINIPQPNNAFVSAFDATKQDMMKGLFEGTLRSVLVCQKCGNKRIQSEPFVSLSLPLSKEMRKASGGETETSNGKTIAVEDCLKHFTLPEALADAVDCPSCGIQTPTTRQHVISRLPKILVLQLKRFDFTENKKIEEYVSFPAHGLNMGPYLPHWREIPRVPESDHDLPLSDEAGATPSILYNLQSTVNHCGTLQSGHYYANVKIDGTWYHCNDAHVSLAPESEVIAQPAYMLFYALDT